jgi:WD40 repeat protein
MWKGRKLWISWGLSVCVAVIPGMMSWSSAPGGDDVFGGGNHRQVGMESAAERRIPITRVGHSVGVDAVAFGANGALLASGHVDNLVRVWQMQTGKIWRTLKGHSSGVTSVSFAPDGALLASGSWDGTIRLWQVAPGTELRTLTGHDNMVSSVAFSPDGALVASGSGDNTVRLWQVQTGEMLRTLTGSNSGVDSIAFSPDGNIIAGANWDKTIRLWSVQTGASLQTLIGHTSGRNLGGIFPQWSAARQRQPGQYGAPVGNGLRKRDANSHRTYGASEFGSVFTRCDTTGERQPG